MPKKIELNVELDKSYGGTSIPSQMNPYPEFSFSEDEPCDIPEAGELTIQFKLVRSGWDRTDPEHPRYSYTVCVKKLLHAVSQELEAPVKKYDETEKALDALAA